MNAIKVGCASKIIKVPLFAELYGYGPFLGRRNRGIRDPLHCRAATFFDGKNRCIIISNDLVTMSRSAAWEIRMELATQTKTPPEGIMVCGSHTHSGPTVSQGIGWGELNQEFRSNWIKTAIATALEAFKDEEKTQAFYGRSMLKEKLGSNRVKENGPTDPEIRWTLFEKENGKTKLLMHNHGMHGVVFGSKMLKVSADWPGGANNLILRNKEVENVLFLQGAEGNVNTNPICQGEREGSETLEKISKSYVDSLLSGIENKKEMKDSRIAFSMKESKLPHKSTNPKKLIEAARLLKEKYPERKYLIDRQEEMAIYMKAGNSIDVTTDLQSIKIGSLFIYAFPGEPFVELGMKTINKSPGQIAFPTAIANGNSRYFPTKETFEKNPDIISESAGYGYYEIHQGCGRFMPEYKDNIAEFIVSELLALGKTL
jgi:hypothetical protein